MQNHKWYQWLITEILPSLSKKTDGKHQIFIYLPFRIKENNLIFIAVKMAFIYSPDKIDALNVSNPKVNRILNCIAISAISSFLKFPLSFHFKYIFVCTICIFFFALSYSLTFLLQTMWSLNLFLLIRTLYYINFILISLILSFFFCKRRNNFSLDTFYMWVERNKKKKYTKKLHFIIINIYAFSIQHLHLMHIIVE